MNKLVAITRVKNSIEDSVKTAIQRVGGMDSTVNKGDEIYLKPNFVAPRDSSQGVTTDFEIIRVVAEEVHRCGGKPILFETPAIEFEKEKVYDFLGVNEFVRENNISLASDSSELINLRVPGGKVFKSIKIPKILHQAKIINLPKLKTHVSARMTCGMKNLIGLLPDSEKRKAHILGIHSAISDLSKIFHPVLTIVDAITCMEGDGPTYGDRIDLGLIISGKNMVDVDVVCSQIIGLSRDAVEYIQLSNDRFRRDDIRIVGEPLKEVQFAFKIPQKSAIYHLSFKVMNTLDVVFSKIFSTPLSQFLYSTGYFGTNPRIIGDKCNQCGECLEVCPIDGALIIESYKVNYKACIRCLNCYLACKHNAIFVKGVSHPEE